MTSIIDHRKYLNRLLAEQGMIRRTAKAQKKSLKTARKYLQACEEAQNVSQEVARAVQERTHERIAGVVTRCLHAVFPNPYDFKIVFESKRGKTDARMVFMRDGKEFYPDDGVGGSVLDVASFALRLACLGLQKPKRRKVVFIDEGFRGISDIQENKDRLREMLVALAEELNFQIIQVTHDEGLKAGKIISL
jgi:DNA repair exonuclease SbcCD ATPase subunit